MRRSAEETDWTQVLEWYDELLRPHRGRRSSPSTVLSQWGEADGPLAGLRALADVPDDVPRRNAVEAWLRERGRRAHPHAHDLYARAAAEAGNLAERDHLHPAGGSDSRATKVAHRPKFG